MSGDDFEAVVDLLLGLLGAVGGLQVWLVLDKSLSWATFHTQYPHVFEGLIGWASFSSVKALICGVPSTKNDRQNFECRSVDLKKEKFLFASFQFKSKYHTEFLSLFKGVKWAVFPSNFSCFLGVDCRRSAHKSTVW